MDSSFQDGFLTKPITTSLSTMNGDRTPLARHVPSAEILTPLFGEAETRHKHLCPRIVLGTRIGLYGLRLLGFVDDSYSQRFRNNRKQLFAFVEIDGCGADGISTAVDCWLVRRTLRHIDYGKMAVTLVKRSTGEAVRVAPANNARELAMQYAPDAQSRWHAYRDAYKVIPDELLLKAQPINLAVSLDDIISRPGLRVDCDQCAEEIVNAREVWVGKERLCRACADGGYFFKTEPFI